MQLLKQLYNKSSHSGEETAMQQFITDYCKAQPNTIVKQDKKGNIYVTRGSADSFPCVVAHMDEIHHKRNKHYQVGEINGILFGIDTKEKELVGIGADDKNGIWVCLNCLQTEEPIKLAFFVEEEIGCCGSSSADMSFFEDCRFVLQCDRKGSSDFITEASSTPLCTSKFIKQCQAKAFGYKEASGLCTDVMELKRKGLKVCAVNLSCGYYNPHTNQEMTDFAELQNCLALVKNIITTVTDVCPHTPKSKRSSDHITVGHLMADWDTPAWGASWQQDRDFEQIKDIVFDDMIADVNRLSKDNTEAIIKLYLTKKYRYLTHSNLSFIELLKEVLDCYYSTDAPDLF